MKRIGSYWSVIVSILSVLWLVILACVEVKGASGPPTRSPSTPTVPVATNSPVPRGRTASPTIDISKVAISRARLDSKMVLTIEFNSPIAIYSPDGKNVKRMACVLLLSQPELYRKDEKDVMCRVSGDGLSIISDALDTSTLNDISYVLTKDGALISTASGNARLGPLYSEISLNDVLRPDPLLTLHESSCGNIYFSWKESTGNVKKTFASAEWIVSGTPETVADEIAASLNANVKDMRTVLSRYELDSRSHGRRFDVQLRLTNWLGISGLSDIVIIELVATTPTEENGNAVTTINIVGTPVTPTSVPFGEPEYTLIGPTEDVDMRSDFLLEVVPAYPLERCAGSGDVKNVPSSKYPIWQALEGPFPKNFKGMHPRGDKFKYMIVAGQLGVGEYKFGVQVSDYQALTISVTISLDNMINVWGGNRSLTVGETAELTLGASFENETVSSLRWVCQSFPFPEEEGEGGESSGLDSLSNPDFLFQDTGSACTGQILGYINRGRGSKSLPIPEDVLALDKIILIHVEYTLYNGGPNLPSLPAYLMRSSATGSFSIQIDASTQPIVGKGKVNVNNPTIIRTQSQEKNLRFIWTQIEGDLDDDTLQMLDLEKSFLRIPAYTLSPGEHYAFRVSVKNTPSLFATISFVANEPPSGGFAWVTPSEGYSGVTDFVMQANYFEDEDLPLAYSWVIAKRNCFEEDCFSQNQAAIFKTLTPFAPETSSIAKLEYFPKHQTIGCIAQDSLGAATEVILSNSTTLVRKPAKSGIELVSDLQQAMASPEEGSKVWTDVLATLSNFDNDSLAASPEIPVAELLQQVLDVSEQASNYAPQRISSLSVENQIPLMIATGFKRVLDENPGVLQSTVGSIRSILDRAKEALENLEQQQAGGSIGSGEMSSLRSLTADTLIGTSSLLSTMTTSNGSVNSEVSIPRDVVSRLIQVQLAIPLKDQSYDQDRFFTSDNIETSFVSRFYDDLLNASLDSGMVGDGSSIMVQFQPSVHSKNSFILPVATLLNGIGESNSSSLVFVSSVHYRLNPFRFERRVANQSLTVSGVTSLQLYNGGSRSQIRSFDSPLKIRMAFNQDSRLISDKALAKNLEVNRTVDGINETIPRRNITERLLCGYFDFDAQKWSDFGCYVEHVGEGIVTCACNHTTDYAAWVETVHEIVLTFTDVSNFSNVKDGIAVLVVLGLWIIGTILFLIWGYYMDERDMERRVRGILLSLKLKRLRDQRVKHRVFRAWRNQVMKESGALVDSSMPLPPALSSLVSIERRNRGAPAPPPELRVDLSTTSKRMWHFFTVSLIREHTLLNTIYLLDPFLTRPMRVLCGAAIVLGEMFAAAVFYHFDTSDDISIGMQILVAILCIILVSPVVALFVVLSRRVAAKPGAQRRYLQQMMVILLAEMGEGRRGDEVQRWAKFAKHVTWDDLKEIHRLQSIKLRIETLKQQHPQTTQIKMEIKSLQHALALQRQVIFDSLSASDAKNKRSLLVDLHERNKRRSVTKDVLPEQDYDLYDLPLSSNTSRWLEKVSHSGSSSSSKSLGVLSPLNKKSQVSMPPPPKSPRAIAAFTPRPFKSETPRPANDRDMNGSDDDEDFRIKARKCCSKWLVRPAFRCIRARPTSWYRSNIPPPESSYYLSHNWIYVSYFILFLYYALAFFYVLSWGFRSKNEAVVNWLPTVAFSIFLDLIVIQPVLIFVRFVVMNEIAYRMDEHEFVSLEYVSARNNLGGTNEAPPEIGLVFDEESPHEGSHHSSASVQPADVPIPQPLGRFANQDDLLQEQSSSSSPPSPPQPQLQPQPQPSSQQQSSTSSDSALALV